MNDGKTRCPHGHPCDMIQAPGRAPGWTLPMGPRECPHCSGKPCGVPYYPGSTSHAHEAPSDSPELAPRKPCPTKECILLSGHGAPCLSPEGARLSGV